MPFIPLEHKDHPGIHLGMWKAEENEKYFLDRLNIYENEQEILNSISHPLKRLEWLSSRLCLKELLKINYKVESLNENTGKPYLSDRSHHISYSHSNLFAGAIASHDIPVAIDLEDRSKKRNPRTRFLFMHPSELEFYEELGDHRLFFLIWSSKETLYKMWANKGLIFKENLLINRERNPLEDFGTVSGIIEKDDFKKEYTIYYHFFSDVLLTYTVDPDGMRRE